MDRFVFTVCVKTFNHYFISLIILLAEISEALQTDEILLNFECSSASTTSIKRLLS